MRQIEKAWPSIKMSKESFVLWKFTWPRRRRCAGEEERKNMTWTFWHEHHGWRFIIN